jgi:hypothetical protein
MSTFVNLVLDEEASSDMPPPLWAIRLDRTDVEAVRCQRIFNYDRPSQWQDGIPGQYVARYRPTVRRGWNYVITFADGSRGTCQVRDFERALAAAGARVDLEAE